MLEIHRHNLAVIPICETGILYPTKTGLSGYITIILIGVISQLMGL